MERSEPAHPSNRVEDACNNAAGESCCEKGISCFKQVFYGAWSFIFSSKTDHNPQTWEESAEPHGDAYAGSFQMHDISTEVIRNDTESSEIILAPSAEDRIYLKGNIRDIYKQQDEILKQIQSSKQAKGKLDVYSLKGPASTESNSLDDSGLPSRLINAIVVTRFVRSRQYAGNAPRDCPICTVTFEDGDPVKILQCLHTYHASCIDQWLAKKSTCPDCKLNLRALDFQQFM